MDEKPTGLLEKPALRGLNVLVVDDNATSRRILTGIVERAGMRPVAAAGSGEALALLQEGMGRRFEIAIIDAQMPGMDGFSLVEQMRKEAASQPAVILLISAGKLGDPDRLRQLGTAAWLVKPVSAAQLIEAVWRAVATSTQPPAPRTASELSSGAPQAVLRVLLAEDNPVNQKVAVRLIEKRGHRAVVAGNGREVLEALARETFDVVLMDVQMPDMDGFEAAAAIRASEKRTGAHLPIIALTAHAMQGDRDRCLAAGMDGYVTKPFQPGALFDAILAVLPQAHDVPRETMG
jgi:CheY-like chemotaxis protein